MNPDLCIHNVKVTVGMCVKNSEATIKEAINSVLNQDFPHKSMELIIVDGCSQDKTLRILKERLKKTDIKTKIFHENKGLGCARQIVVNNANGEYIIWVDGDMILSKDFIRKQVEFMDFNQSIGIAKGKYGILTNRRENLVAFLENIEFVLNTLLEEEVNDKVLGTSGCIYRVKAIRQVGGFNPNFKGVGEDMDAENRIQEAGWKLYISPAVFYETRRQSWRALWDEYFWHGKGGNHLFRENKHAISFKIFPLVAFATKLFQISIAYRLTRRKSVILLPLHYAFKRIAWLFGLLKGLLEKEGIES